MIHGETGWLFNEQTVPTLVQAIHDFEQQFQTDPIRISQHVQQFSTERFRQQIQQLINCEFNKERFFDL